MLMKNSSTNSHFLFLDGGGKLGKVLKFFDICIINGFRVLALKQFCALCMALNCGRTSHVRSTLFAGAFTDTHRRVSSDASALTGLAKALGYLPETAGSQVAKVLC